MKSIEPCTQVANVLSDMQRQTVDHEIAESVVPCFSQSPDADCRNVPRLKAMSTTTQSYECGNVHDKSCQRFKDKGRIVPAGTPRFGGSSGAEIGSRRDEAPIYCRGPEKNETKKPRDAEGTDKRPRGSTFSK